MLNLPSLNNEEISDYEDGINAWQHQNPGTKPEVPEVQRCWDSIQINRLSDQLEFDNEEDKARVLAIQKPEAACSPIKDNRNASR